MIFQGVQTPVPPSGSAHDTPRFYDYLYTIDTVKKLWTVLTVKETTILKTVAQLVTSPTADPLVVSPLVRSHTFVEIDHKIICTVILLLPLIQEGLLSVTGESMFKKYWLTA